jgi:immune inhibitor A
MTAALSFLAALAVSCAGGREPSRPTTTPTLAPDASPAPSQTPGSEAALPAPPDRDLLDLARRLGRLPRSAGAPRPSPVVGSRRTFFVTVIPPGAIGGDALPSVREATAVLLAASEHALFYWEEGFEPAGAAAQHAAETFETVVRPAVTPVLGEQPGAGVDGGDRIIVLHADLGGGAGGYFADTDTVPLWAAPYSNEADMVYLDASTPPDSPAYAPLLAHEYQHLLQFAHDPGEESWVNEGLSEFVAGLTASYGGRQRAFLENPRLRLNSWDGSGADYGKAYLWFDYLAQRFGSDLVASIARDPRDGDAGVAAALANAGARLEDVLADWATANYADLTSGPYAYPGTDVSVSPTASIRRGERLERDVPQFAADYVAIEGEGRVRLTFEGATAVPVVRGLAMNEGVWWSNRGDSIDSRLTREFDLTGVARATLTFTTWFDIERGWDYGYVEVSADGGKTWAILGGEATSDVNPVGIAYGPGYTGRSGGGDEPAWIEERIDLTPFAGRRILLRFEYVTDGGLHREGWAIDHIRIPELGYADDATDPASWRTEGFALLGRTLPQRFALRLVQGGQVTSLPLDSANRATFDVDLSAGSAALIVVALTGESTAPATYALSAAG